jgi:two-component SAPR family response regulator
MHDVRAELVRRMEIVERGGSVATLPELVVLAPELERLLDHLSTLDILGSYGAAHRVRLLVASARSQDLPDELVAHFSARAVLRLSTELESTRLLGSTAAADLLGGGQLLLRLDQREPVEAYAFRVSEPVLDRAVRMLRGETVPARSMEVARSEADLPETLEDDDSDVIPTPSSSRGRDLGSNHEIPRLRLGMTTLRAAVDVRCFGGFDVQAGAADLTAASSPAEAAERAAAWELLAFLGSQAEGVVPREDVLLALWPGQDSRQAVASLHAAMEGLNALLEPALSRLAAAAPPVTLDSRDGTVRLDLNRVESDVHQFLRLCRAASLMPLERAAETWARARELYRGDLLDGPGARTYSWVSAAVEDGELSPRTWLREQYYRATLRQARLLVQVDRVAEAIPLFHALLDLEPLLEDVVRDLYRCHAARGDLAALIAEDERLRQALRLALGPDDDLDPEPATAALFAELREELEVKASVTA